MKNKNNFFLLQKFIQIKYVYYKTHVQIFGHH